MADFRRRDDRPRGRREFGGRGQGNSDRQMYKATCDNCGKECQVPFKPTSGKPVYCNDCFAKNQGQDSRRPERGGFSSRRSSFGDKRMYDAVCDNCGNNCKVPFQPTSGKPIYCSNCFESKNDKGGGNTNTGQYKEQFEALNTKLDKILAMLTPAVTVETPKVTPKPEKTKRAAKKKAAKKPASS